MIRALVYIVPVLSSRTTLSGVICATVALVLSSAPRPARASDPGFRLELDRERYELNVSDLRSGEAAAPIRVVLGSPANPTPSGSFPVSRVILNPSWHPGSLARSAGAEPEPPSLSGPMGVAKLPFADGGQIALHGGGDPLLLGKPVSGGCVRASDADLLRIIAWLHLRGAFSPPEEGTGEIVKGFLRPARLIVR